MSDIRGHSTGMFLNKILHAILNSVGLQGSKIH